MAENALSALDVDSVTGLDPARILKECAPVVCVPGAVLLTRTIGSGEWPSPWAKQWTMPLCKE